MSQFMGADLEGMLDTVGSGLGDLFRPRAEVPSGLANLAFGQRSSPWERLAFGQVSRPSVWQGLNFGQGSGGAVGLTYGGGNAVWERLAFGDGGVGPTLGAVDYWNQKKAQTQAEKAAARAKAAEVAARGQPVSQRPGATGSYNSGADQFEQYRSLIEKHAKDNGIDPDALAAMLFIETDGDPTAVSHAGARGLGQIMPSTWQGLADPGDDPFNADHSIKNAARYFAENYRTYGSYELAAAAYLGGPNGVTNGKPTVGNFDGPGGVGGTDSATYAAIWNRHFSGIKATSASAPRGGTPGGSSYASLFGGTTPPISQGFGHTDYSDGPGKAEYNWGTSFGLDGDEHTGWDVGVGRGTQFYMPEGMSGVVSINGCTEAGCFYTTNSGTGTGKGELRIALDNGDVLILGHNDRIDVKVGQRVTAGMLLGLTGSSGGDHLHIEIRRPDSSMPGGYRIIDPATVFGPPGTGSGGSRS